LDIYNERAREIVKNPSLIWEAQGDEPSAKRHRPSSQGSIPSSRNRPEPQPTSVPRVAPANHHPRAPPIILVPNVQDTVLGFVNARDLLYEAKYIPLQEKLKTGGVREDVHSFVRENNGHRYKYEIRHRVGEKDW
jgi:hypothetical protein